MTRLHKILIGLLVVQIALSVFIMVRDDGVRLAPMKPVIPKLDVAAVTRVQVFDKNGEKPVIELAKAGDAWQLASHFNHPVAAGKVDEILGKLGAMKSRGPIATTQVRHEQLGVADKKFERKIVLVTAKGETTVWIGGAGGGRLTAVRVGTDARVWGVTGLTAWQIETVPGQWVDPAYVALEKEQISRIVVQGKSSVELEKAQAGWQLSIAGQPIVLGPGETLDTAAVDRIVGQIAKLDITQPADPKRDASAPLATISIWTAAPGDRPGDTAPAQPAPDPATASSAERQADHVIDVMAEANDFWVHERGKPTAGIATRAMLADAVELARDKVVKKPEAPAKSGPTPPLPGQPPAPSPGPPSPSGRPPGAAKPAAPKPVPKAPKKPAAATPGAARPAAGSAAPPLPR